MSWNPIGDYRRACLDDYVEFARRRGIDWVARDAEECDEAAAALRKDPALYARAVAGLFGSDVNEESFADVSEQMAVRAEARAAAAREVVAMSEEDRQRRWTRHVRPRRGHNVRDRIERNRP